VLQHYIEWSIVQAMRNGYTSCFNATIIKFGCNTINGHKIITTKIMPIRCHGYRVTNYNGKKLKISEEIH